MQCEDGRQYSRVESRAAPHRKAPAVQSVPVASATASRLTLLLNEVPTRSIGNRVCRSRLQLKATWDAA